MSEDIIRKESKAFMESLGFNYNYGLFSLYIPHNTYWEYRYSLGVLLGRPVFTHYTVNGEYFEPIKFDKDLDTFFKEVKEYVLNTWENIQYIKE